jgi:hypothetical protein
MRTERGWEMAGLVRDSGALYRPLATTEIEVPKRVDITGERAVWNPDDVRRVQPGAGLLEGFVDLTRDGEANPLDVKRHAERWGVLEICEHGLPRTHNPGREKMVSRVAKTLREVPFELPCFPLGYDLRVATGRAKGPLRCWTPLTAWAQLSRRARAILNIAARLHQEQAGDLRDWHVLLGRGETFEIWKAHGSLPRRIGDWDRAARRLWGSRLGFERWQLVLLLGDWLRIADVRPMVEWQAGAVALRMYVPTLFSAIAMQLVLAIGRADALAICAHCRRSYIPKRKPVEGRRNFCQDCREKGIPMRYVMDDRRRRERRERKTTGGKTRTR